MIAVKHLNSLDEWASIHPRLREVLIHLHAIWPVDGAMVITRIYDPPVEGESGVHRTKPHRAADIRTEGIPFVDGRILERRLNEAWDYGKDGFNVALYHGGTGLHLHLQVRDQTRRRNA